MMATFTVMIDDRIEISMISYEISFKALLFQLLAELVVKISY